MSTANKITFGNTSGTTYSINNPTSFAYATGDYIQPANNSYQGQSTNFYGGATSNYQPYIENREVAYGGQSISQGYSVPTNYSTVQVANPTNLTYGATQDISRPSQTTKITFGGKQVAQTYRVPQYETISTYTPPAVTYAQPFTTYQTYQTYTQPTEIPTIISQPIREEVRVEQHAYQPKQVEREEFVSAPAPVVSTVSAPVDEKRKSKKKGFACPSWIWYLLGALLLIGLIVGLIFLFKNLNIGGGSAPTIATNGTATAETPTGGAATTTGGATTTNETTVTGTTTGGSTVTTGEVSGTSTSSESNSTSGSTTGTTWVTPSDNTSTSTTTTTTTNTTGTSTGTTTVTPVDDDSFAIDPVFIAPTAVSDTNTWTVANPVTTTTTSSTNDWSSSWSSGASGSSGSSGTWSSTDAWGNPTDAWGNPTDAWGNPTSSSSTGRSDSGYVAIADPASAFIPTTSPSYDYSTSVNSASVY